MSPKTDLIANLEAEAVKQDQQAAVCDRFRLSSGKYRQHAANLRAAAAAVRLVGECREALAAIRNEVSAGCHPDAPVEELKTGIHYEPVLVVDTVIEKIAEWEGKHGQ